MTIEPTLIDARCFCDKCRDRTEDIYRMISALCINCGAGPFLILYRAGDKAHARDCPVCGTYWSVKPSRLATDDEIPIVAAHLGSDETGAKPADVHAPLVAQPSGLTDSSPSSREERHGVAQALVDKVRRGFPTINASGYLVNTSRSELREAEASLEAMLVLIDELADRLYTATARLDRGDLTRLGRALRAEARVEALKAALRTIAENKLETVELGEGEPTVVDGDPASVVYVRRERPNAQAVARAALAEIGL